MTEQITVPRATWDALVKALVRLKIEVVLSDIPLAYVESHFREHLDIAENAITAANAVSDHFRGVTEMMQPLGWYCVSRDGLATQCADQRDAEVTAESANRDWPNSAPYRAVQLCEFEAHPQATEPAGYKLVPVNATPEMIAAAEQVEDLYRRGTPDTWGSVYRAMLAAAPEAKQ